MAIDIINTIYPAKEYEGIYYDLAVIALSLVLISVAVSTFDQTWRYIPILLFSTTFFFLLIPIFDFFKHTPTLLLDKGIDLSRLELTTFGLLIIIIIIGRLLYESIVKLQFN